MAAMRMCSRIRFGGACKEHAVALSLTLDEAGRLWAHQLQLTIADIVDEVHDTHHPIVLEPLLRGSARRSPAARRRFHR
jgi:hypothetical protein